MENPTEAEEELSVAVPSATVDVSKLWQTKPKDKRFVIFTNHWCTTLVNNNASW